MRPVRRVLNVTPSAAYRRASVLKPATIADRWVLDRISGSIGSRTDEDATFKTRPQPRCSIPGSARSISAIGASTSERYAASHCSRVNDSGSPGGGPPVLQTRMSIGPSSRSISSTSGPAPSRSLVSQAKRSVLRELAATRAPSASSSAAIAAPIPFDAPVSSATLPVSPRSTPAQITLHPVHAEITALVVGAEQLEVAVAVSGSELIARRRDGGEEVRVPVSHGRVELPFAL